MFLERVFWRDILSSVPYSLISLRMKRVREADEAAPTSTEADSSKRLKNGVPSQSADEKKPEDTAPSSAVQASAAAPAAEAKHAKHLPSTVSQIASHAFLLEPSRRDELANVASPTVLLIGDKRLRAVAKPVTAEGEYSRRFDDVYFLS
jgi:hypothetical protein